jgi:hypothetical protein
MIAKSARVIDKINRSFFFRGYGTCAKRRYAKWSGFTETA